MPRYFKKFGRRRRIRRRRRRMVMRRKRLYRKRSVRFLRYRVKAAGHIRGFRYSSAFYALRVQKIRRQIAGDPGYFTSLLKAIHGHWVTNASYYQIASYLAAHGATSLYHHINNMARDRMPWLHPRWRGVNSVLQHRRLGVVPYNRELHGLYPDATRHYVNQIPPGPMRKRRQTKAQASKLYRHGKSRVQPKNYAAVRRSGLEVARRTGVPHYYYDMHGHRRIVGVPEA